MRQDSALLAYDATAYQRISAGLGFRAFGRDRLLFRTENVSRVRWSRENGAWVDLKGARTVIPMVKHVDPDEDMEPEEMSPIPYYPGREALWIGNGVAKAEVDPEDMIHPLAVGSEAYYRFAIGRLDLVQALRRESHRAQRASHRTTAAELAAVRWVVLVRREHGSARARGISDVGRDGHLAGCR